MFIAGDTTLCRHRLERKIVSGPEFAIYWSPFLQVLTECYSCYEIWYMLTVLQGTRWPILSATGRGSAPDPNVPYLNYLYRQLGLTRL